MSERIDHGNPDELDLFEPTRWNLIESDPRIESIMRIMFCSQGTTWDDEHSDGSTFMHNDVAYMQEEARDYIAALDLLAKGATPEQVEDVIVRHEPFVDPNGARVEVTR